MNKEQYLKELKRYLRRLPNEEYEDAIDYFTECFDEAGVDGEQELIAELGTPKEAAMEIFSTLLDKQTGKREIAVYEGKKSDPLKGVLIAILAICAAPIGIPLLIVILALIFAGICVAASLILCVVCIAIAGFLAGIKLFIRGILAIPFSIPGAFLVIGTGITIIGIGILSVVLSIFICKCAAKGFVWLTNHFLKKGGERNERKK
ncbi:MAG: DUF1700 domain-containing protein [Lachnospiraceae bacterium]